MSAPLELTLYADSKLIYVADDRDDIDIADAWTEQAFRNRIGVAPGWIGIGCIDHHDVRVTVMAGSSAPPDDSSTFDRVNEASLEITSGRLVVAGMGDYWPEAARLEVSPGSWRIRVSHSGLATGQEAVRLQLWPAPYADPVVTKRWTPPAT